jgi:hypothetical protein
VIRAAPHILESLEWQASAVPVEASPLIQPVALSESLPLVR